MNLHKLANPAAFMRVSERLLPWLLVMGCGLLAYGVYLSFFASPPDYQQGETVRIMYVHVPAAWLSMAGYGFMAVCSAIWLVWKHTLADLLARAAAPVGMGFTLIVLVTGSLWGKPMWGTWWVWDARLTSVLLLFFLYLGYVAMTSGEVITDQNRRAAAVLSLIGALNLPIIKFSVEWWNTLHQPASVLRMDGPSIDSTMLWPLLVMFAALLLLFIVTVIHRTHALLLRQKLRRLQLQSMQQSTR